MNERDIPAQPKTPVPPTDTISVAELADMVRHRHVDRGRALFALVDRAARDDRAATALGELSRLPQTRDYRVFHLASLAWAAVIGLLAAETAHARRVAYDAFAALDERDRRDLLAYLKVERIEDAHPSV